MTKNMIYGESKIMDLRIERTRKCIKDAFIELRKTKPIEKITVKELAALASINKATFYSHYTDIYDLSEQMEEETIQSILETIPHIDCLVSNPPLAVKELTDALKNNLAYTSILFSGSREGLYSLKLEKGIKNQIFTQYPDFKDDLRWNLILTFLIQGGQQAYHSYNFMDEKETINLICELNNCVRNHFFQEDNI